VRTVTNNARIKAIAAQVRELIDAEFGKDNAVIDGAAVIGEVFLGFSYGAGDIGNNLVNWSLSDFIAQKVGPIIPRIVAFHDFLVESGATREKPWDCGYADRYAAPMLDSEGRKVFVVQTQCLTYMVSLKAEKVFLEDAEGRSLEDRVHNSWSLQIRVCNSNREDEGFQWVSFKSGDLDFLTDAAGIKESAYFRYCDFRDRGWVLGVRPGFVASEPSELLWEGGDSYSRFMFAKGVMYDLSCHASMVEDYRKDAGLTVAE
jgi:hypothetical protein